MKKCKWCQDGGLLEHYHDTEWGIPCHDERMLFEYLMLESMSCGLSWNLMLRKREIFHACFADFDYEAVARFTEADINRAMEYPGMIRSRRKIEAIVSNAQCFMQIQQEFGSFDRYLWGYTGGKTYVYRRRLGGEQTGPQAQAPASPDAAESPWQTKNELSDTIAADLKKRGFKFLGSTLVYSYLQSVGLVNDHDSDCFLFEEIGGTLVK